MKLRRRENLRTSRRSEVDVEASEPTRDVINTKEIADKWMDRFLVDIDRARRNIFPLYYAMLLELLVDVDREAFNRLAKPETGLVYFRRQLLENPLLICPRVSILVRMYPEAKQGLEEMYELPIRDFFQRRSIDRQDPVNHAASIINEAIQLLFLHPQSQSEIRQLAGPAVQIILKASLANSGFFRPPTKYDYFKELLLLDPSLRPTIQAYVRTHASEARKALREAEELNDVDAIFGILTDFNVIQADEAEVLPNGELKLTKKNRLDAAPTVPLPLRPTF